MKVNRTDFDLQKEQRDLPSLRLVPSGDVLPVGYYTQRDDGQPFRLVSVWVFSSPASRIAVMSGK